LDIEAVILGTETVAKVISPSKNLKTKVLDDRENFSKHFSEFSRLKSVFSIFSFQDVQADNSKVIGDRPRESEQLILKLILN